MSERARSWYEVAAKFPGAGLDPEVACCFDPRMVITRLGDEFGDLLECDRKDVSWKDHEHFRQQERTPSIESCLRTAELDAMRRGPNFPFRIRREGRAFQGNAERYVVRLRGPEPIPEGGRNRRRACPAC